MKALPKIWLTVFCTSVVISGTAQNLPEASVVVRVIDESGRPFANAEVTASFEQPYKINVEPVKLEVQRVQTDTNGFATITGKTTGHVGWGVKFRGYYTSYAKPLDFLKREKDQWLPWGQTNTIVIKKIGNPIAMYAKSVNLGVPEMSGEIGFDLAKGDWIQPYGKGQQSDILFRGELIQKDRDDFHFRLIVTFPNKGDGIQPFDAPPGLQGSALKSAHEAPSDGYLAEWTQFRLQRPGSPEESNIDRNRNYYFRIRTVPDEKGRTKSANYGKIYGDFMQFRYYFNPEPNSRNVEFDPKQNLLKGLSSFEETDVP